jgi:hypothetical protein
MPAGDMAWTRPGPQALVCDAGGYAVTGVVTSPAVDDFMVMRMTHGHDAHDGGSMTPLATLAENTTEYHDTAIESGIA